MNGTSTLIRTYELVPNQSGKLATNITPIVKDYMVKPDLLNDTDIYTITDYKLFRIYVAEYYSGAQHSVTYKDIYVLNSKPRNIQDELLHLLPYVTNNKNDFLTNSSRQTVNLDIGKPIFFALLTKNKKITITVSLASSSYGKVSKEFYISYTNKLVNFNLTKYIIDNFTLQQRNNAEVITVELNNELYTQIYHYTIDRCNELIPICWYNELGGIESLHMFDYFNETETKQSTYIRHQHLYNDGYVKGGTVVANATQVERRTLWTQWIQDTEAEYFSKSLMQAKDVYLITRNESGAYEYDPVAIIASTVKHNRNEYNDLVNVSITVETNRYDNL